MDVFIPGIGKGVQLRSDGHVYVRCRNCTTAPLDGALGYDRRFTPLLHYKVDAARKSHNCQCNTRHTLGLYCLDFIPKKSKRRLKLPVNHSSERPTMMPMLRKARYKVSTPLEGQTQGQQQCHAINATRTLHTIQ